MIRSLMLLLFLAIGHYKSMAQTTERHMIAFYNVENLFDTIDDPATLDESMLPLADREWTDDRYQHKIASVARVISDMTCDGHLPAIVGLAEVENRGVLELLTSHPTIKSATYQICHFDSPDSRGIDVALLYRPELFIPTDARAVPVTISDIPYFSTRDILVVRGKFCDEDFMFVVVHWPSRIGGMVETEHLRMACARKVREITDTEMYQNPDCKIVILGDMNDNPLNRSLRKVLQARCSPRGLRPDEFYNPFARRFGIGSSRYNGKWNHFDNIILSANLVGASNAQIYFDPTQKRNSVAYVFRRDYMCNKRGYPLRTYQGAEYTGGISDHLPVCLIIQQSLGKRIKSSK